MPTPCSPFLSGIETDRTPHVKEKSCTDSSTLSMFSHDVHVCSAKCKLSFGWALLRQIPTLAQVMSCLGEPWSFGWAPDDRPMRYPCLAVHRLFFVDRCEFIAITILPVLRSHVIRTVWASDSFGVKAGRSPKHSWCSDVLRDHSWYQARCCSRISTTVGGFGEVVLFNHVQPLLGMMFHHVSPTESKPNRN